jgi:DnaJ family protein C protein 9
MSKGSPDEERDIIEAYTLFRGNVDKMLENVMLSTLDDLDKWANIISSAIQSGKADPYRSWSSGLKKVKQSMTQRKRKADKEAKEAEELASELGLKNKLLKASEEEDSIMALQRAIRANHASKMSEMMERLEQKYAKGASSKTRKGKKAKK